MGRKTLEAKERKYVSIQCKHWFCPDIAYFLLCCDILLTLWTFCVNFFKGMIFSDQRWQRFLTWSSSGVVSQQPLKNFVFKTRTVSVFMHQISFLLSVTSVRLILFEGGDVRVIRKNMHCITNIQYPRPL